MVKIEAEEENDVDVKSKRYEIFISSNFIQVSWVRRRDWHILTSGMFTYTNDERFQVSHTDGGDDWNLQIKYVQKRDNGTYECQVSEPEAPDARLFPR